MVSGINFERLKLSLALDEFIDVEVVEETENPCAGQVTNWMEFHYPNNDTHETYESLRYAYVKASSIAPMVTGTLCTLSPTSSMTGM